MTERGLLIVLSGPSGVGKDTILECFLRERQDCVLSVSATTRAPRAGEADGENYYFMDTAGFNQLIETGRMLEYAAYSGSLYGTPAKPVEEQRNAGKNVILEIEVQGALLVRQKCPDAVFVFIMPPDISTLCSRLLGRGTESKEAVAKRMEAAKEEMKLAKLYDYIIVNEQVDDAAKKLSAVVTAAGCGATRMITKIREVCNNA